MKEWVFEVVEKVVERVLLLDFWLVYNDRVLIEVGEDGDME